MFFEPYCFNLPTMLSLAFPSFLFIKLTPIVNSVIKLSCHMENPLMVLFVRVICLLIIFTL